VKILTILAVLALAQPACAQAAKGPIIDMHLHASRLSVAKGVPVCPGSAPLSFPGWDPKTPLVFNRLITCDRPLYSPLTADDLRRQSLAELKKHNVVRAITAGRPAQVAAWRAADPERIVPAVNFAEDKPPSIGELRRLYREKSFEVFAEVSTQYLGLSADDPRFEPYWALAEELDIPVGIHLGESLPGINQGSDGATYRARLTSPYQLEEVLIRHPKLRIYVMHYGSPLVDDMISMLFTYPSLYVDVAANDWNLPLAEFHDHLKRLIDAGFGKRILFGSDQTIWPQGIGEAIDGIDSAPFLSEAQKRDIFYDNAARFLRLTPEQIARDHRP
jgi:predicted TIM-barrel fold metal-dependent hydrolase